MLCHLLFLRYRQPLSSTVAKLVSFSSTLSPPPPPTPPPKGGGPLPSFGVPFAAGFVGSLIGGFSISSYDAAGAFDLNTFRGACNQTKLFGSCMRDGAAITRFRGVVQRWRRGSTSSRAMP